MKFQRFISSLVMVTVVLVFKNFLNCFGRSIKVFSMVNLNQESNTNVLRTLSQSRYGNLINNKNESPFQLLF